MPMGLFVVAACAMISLAGCSPFSGGVFPCQESSQCGAGGVCQPSGFCSFADDSCASGQRYGEYAGGGLPGACVDQELDPDGGPDEPDAPPEEPFCNPDDSALVACYRFEGDLADESGNGNTPTVAHDGYDTGIDGMAVRTRVDTELPITDNTSFDVTRLTLEAWVLADELPATGARAGLFDVNGQYGFFILPDGVIRCTAGGPQVNAPGAVVVGTWVHLACTYDGAAMVAYVNGKVAAMEPATGVPPVNADNSVALAGDAPDGDPFIGLIDNFRLWGVARSEAEICAAASCSAP